MPDKDFNQWYAALSAVFAYNAALNAEIEASRANARERARKLSAELNAYRERRLHAEWRQRLEVQHAD